MLACVCRRSCNRTPAKPARRDTARHGRLRSCRQVSEVSPSITYFPFFGNPVRIASAGALSTIVLRPVLLSGSSRRPRSVSTCSHSRLRISRRRAPVRIRSLRAAAACASIMVLRFLGMCFAFLLDSSTSQGTPMVSASRMLSPKRANSSVERKRSRRCSRNASMCATGLTPRARTLLRTCTES